MEKLCYIIRSICPTIAKWKLLLIIFHIPFRERIVFFFMEEPCKSLDIEYKTLRIWVPVGEATTKVEPEQPPCDKEKNLILSPVKGGRHGAEGKAERRKPTREQGRG